VNARFSEFDHQAMRLAVELASRGWETTHPNPPVGCVIAKDNVIVGKGWHQRAGGPHAEVEALRAAGEAAAGATVYVTLEPCNHHGRTPPCVDALIQARVARVVFAVADPNPRVPGGGARRLESAGIKVESGLLEAEATAVNEGFLKRMRTGRPFVRVKAAMSLDGRTALASGESQWITGEAARADVQNWRARSSAVLTGIGTILADDPRLNVRKPGATRQPMRVVLDRQLRTPPTARLFESDGDVIIFTQSSDATRRAALEARGARLEEISSLDQVLQRLAALEVNDLWVEAGPTLTGAFASENLIDELIVYIAPMLLGPDARPLMHLPPLSSLRDARRFTIVEVTQHGADVRLRMRSSCSPESFRT
jgi:diaminohydroxyphosphoribosylaminopyrimidine deaminase/5-amino-6-(5-phosphoribosylamino)uracil reductase